MELKKKYGNCFSKEGRFSSVASLGAAAVLLMIGVAITACSNTPSDPAQKVLIQVGNSQVTVREFKQIQDMSQDYYWQDDEMDTGDPESKSLRLLNQITEELLLTEHAKKIGISVDEKDLETAVQDIKSDYPEGTFEQVLLEGAVSYDFWRARLRTRLLMDKVIEKELESKVSITPQDISDFYKKNYAALPERQLEKNSSEKDRDINELIIRRLRKLKAEERYKDWIKKLENAYPVQVNWEVWKRIMNS